jgi:hypothetical protein
MNAALDRVAALMHDFGAPWGIAGGWALDLFVGRESRVHADTDVAILRQDQQRLRAQLGPADVAKVVNHQLSPWRAGEQLQPPIHEVHATWPDGFRLELLLNECDAAAQEWVYRRDHRVRRPLNVAFSAVRGFPILAPELVLLFKSKAPESKDDADFEAVRQHLSNEQCSWLKQTLEVVAPNHHWTPLLSQAPWQT